MTKIQEILTNIREQLGNTFSQNERVQVSKMLLMNYLDIQNSEILLKKDEEVSDEIIDRIEKDLKRINDGEPVQYVIGTTYFYGFEMKIDSRALIPRPETEELVDWVFKELQKKQNKSPKILDVGTGSGCIALALQAGLPNGEIHGTDVNQKALDLAIENAMAMELKVDFEQADALNLSEKYKNKWDIIVSNPPYIPQKDKTTMQAHVLEHEPHSALFVPDNDALKFYKAIAEYAKYHLNKEGKLFFEIHENLAVKVKEILSSKGFSKIELRKDLQGKNRMICAQV